MRTYVIAAGLIFALLVVLHIWRAIIEPHLARDPFFLMTTVIAASFALAAWRVSRRSA